VINIKISLIFLLAALSTACAPRYSSVPSATTFESSEQSKLQAAKHWELIAKNISNNLKADVQTKISKQEKIYIYSAQKTPFTRSISMEVIASLTRDGYRVIKPKNMDYVDPSLYSVKIDIETEVLEFSKGRKQSSRVGVPSVIATGLWILSALDPTPAGGATLAAYGYDAYNWFGDKQLSGNVPQSEVIVDLVTSKNDEYISITKDIYYVSDSDKGLYQAAQEVYAKNYKIVGVK